MTRNEPHDRSLREFGMWAESLAAAGCEGLRYEKWWEARLPIEEIRRQNIADQVERGRQALAFSRRLTEAK
jgi:hypothetical protein